MMTKIVADDLPAQKPSPVRVPSPIGKSISVFETNLLLTRPKTLAVPVPSKYSNNSLSLLLMIAKYSCV